ncbi:DNA cytosine methyltransferase [Streptococcus pluranimalium]|uniref:DNA cytosine methyltransferase n=1 Tax=Streptococcus pluranimalium TaxID=82348 RepID=UPI0039FD0DB0
MKINFIDLFAGIGGFRIALEKNGAKCVFSSEIDKFARETYKENFNEIPHGDIFEIKSENIPDHDILCAGFPCQPFSIAGKRLGFDDVRGTLFFEVARIINDKRPRGFILENVAGIVNHDNGKTLTTITNILEDLNYSISWKLLNAKDYGVPQNRNRWYCVGINNEMYCDEIKPNLQLVFPEKKELMLTLKNIISDNEGVEHKVSKVAINNMEIHINEFLNRTKQSDEPIIANNIRPSKVSFSCNGISPCLTAKMGTGGNNVPVIYQQKRKLSIKECLKIMGFPEDYKIKSNYSQSYKQLGNSIIVPIVDEIAKNLIDIFNSLEKDNQRIK